MKTLGWLWCAVALCAWTWGWSAEEKKDEKKPVALKVETLKQAPKVDGVLDDEGWKGAATVSAFKNQDGAATKGKGRILIGQDDKNLYVAVECQEDEATLKGLTADTTAHDGDEIWKDDEVELFIDPTGKRQTYYQIIVNAKGVTWDAYHSSPKNPDMNWEPKYQSAVKVGKTSWVLEFAFPWAIFDQTEKFEKDWVFNLVWTRKAAEEECYWAPVESTSAHTPENFGVLNGIIGVKPPKEEAKK